MRAALLAFSLLATPLAAQDADLARRQRPDPLVPQGENLATPPTWSVRFDAPHGDHAPEPTVGADSTADVFFVNMTPGWHVTTGPAGVLYHPASTASGAFRAERTSTSSIPRAATRHSASSSAGRTSTAMRSATTTSSSATAASS